jgi:hypothetical protein
VSEQLQPTTIEALEASRELVAPGPSGHVYRIRPLNMERHALAGGLPQTLRHVALGGVADVEKALNEAAGSDDGSAGELREYLDGIVRQVVVEPSLEGVDLDVLPPADYRWLLLIGFGELDVDGEGRRLWGREPLSRFRVFAEAHGCDADCVRCERARAALSRGVQ